MHLSNSVIKPLPQRGIRRLTDCSPGYELLVPRGTIREPKGTQPRVDDWQPNRRIWIVCKKTNLPCAAINEIPPGPPLRKGEFVQGNLLQMSVVYEYKFDWDDSPFGKGGIQGGFSQLDAQNSCRIKSPSFTSVYGINSNRCAYTFCIYPCCAAHRLLDLRWTFSGCASCC